MKIVHVVWYSRFGGVESYTRDLFRELERRGHRNVVLVAGQILDGLVVPGRGVYGLPEIIELGRGATKPALSKLAPILEAESPDVAYLHTAMNEHAAWFILDRLPTVYFAHSYTAISPSGALYHERTRSVCPSNDAPGWRCLVNAYARRCNSRRPDHLLATYRRARQTGRWTRAADAVVCDSTYVAERHVAAGFDRRRIHVLPSPVPIPALEHTASSSKARPPVILFAGRLVGAKGLDVLVRALPAVNPDAVTVVAGDGPLLAESQQLARSLKVAHRVRFAGRVSPAEMRSLYQAASLVVVPSLWPEPLGMVGPEALSYARPVVASSLGGIGEWMVDGLTGLQAAPNNAEELAAAINRLLADPGHAEQLGRAGRRLVEERFSLAHHADRLVHVFATVHAQRRPPTARQHAAA